jgi:hypothetical protein
MSLLDDNEYDPTGGNGLYGDDEYVSQHSDGEDEVESQSSSEDDAADYEPKRKRGAIARAPRKRGRDTAAANIERAPIPSVPHARAPPMSRALVVVPPPRRGIYDEKSFVAALTVLHTKKMYGDALALIESDWVKYPEAHANALFRIVSSRIKKLLPDLHPGDIEAVIKMATILFRRICKTPKHDQRPLPVCALALTLDLGWLAPQLQSLAVDALVASGMRESAFKGLWRNLHPDERHVRFIAALISRTKFAIEFPLEIGTGLGANVDAMAFLAERALARGRLPGQFNWNGPIGPRLLACLLKRWNDAKMVFYMNHWCGKQPDDVAAHPDLVAPFETDRFWRYPMTWPIWRRVQHHNYLNMALPLLQWGLSPYPVVWVLEYLYCHLSIGHVRSVQLVDKLQASTRNAMLRRAPPRNAMARLE